MSQKRHLIFQFLLCTLCVLPLQAADLESNPPTQQVSIVEIKPIEKPILWVTNDTRKDLTLMNWDDRSFISISDLARISEAQLGWQAPSQQACLSRVDSLVCCNWGLSTVFVDGKMTSPHYPVKLHDNKLYVAFEFATSKYFQKFSQTSLQFNPEKIELVQTIPVTLEIPSVNNMGDRYQLSLDVNSDSAYRILKKSDDQIWIRFPGAVTAGSSVLEGDDVIQEVKINQKRHSADLLVKLGSGSSDYDLSYDKGAKKLTLSVFLRNAQEPKPVDSDPMANLVPKGGIEPKVETGPMKPIAEAPPVDTPKAVLKTPQTSSAAPIPKEDGVRTIVIDAGHGGFDSGAMGVRGTYEKDINLRVAEALADRLKKEKNIRVIMTREADMFLSLDDRTKRANAARADLFVSIHCNSSISAKHTGFEVYLLAPEASDEAADSVARFENSVVALESKKGDRSEKLSGLLASMAVNTYMNDSSELAAMICRSVKKTSAVKETSVKEANFYVLRGVQMPSVLIEMDYLSNPISELKLRSSRFASIVAKGMSDGVKEFDSRQRKKEEIFSARYNQGKSGTSQ